MIEKSEIKTSETNGDITISQKMKGLTKEQLADVVKNAHWCAKTDPYQELIINKKENMALLIEEEQKDIYKIADHYGEGIQQLKLIEECGELIVAVAKGEDKNIIEELADVSIMLEQVVYLMDCKKKFKMAKAMKINRQLGRMEGEE